LLKADSNEEIIKIIRAEETN
jgi:hypothetical protein